MKTPNLFSQALFLWLEDFLDCRVTNTMISLPAKNNVKTNKNAKQRNPHYFIKTRNLMSTRHMQIAAVKLSSATSSTRHLPVAAEWPREQTGRGFEASEGCMLIR